MAILGGILHARVHHKSSRTLNSTQKSPDNLFLRGHASLRKKRLTLPASLTLLALTPLLVLFVLTLWFGQFQLQRDIAHQADQAGSELARQIATLVADPLAADDPLSVNIILAQWAQNPMIAHASLANANNRTVAEAGRRPGAEGLAPGQGRFVAAVHFQDELLGQLHLSLAREPFAAPLANLLQGLLWSIALLAAVTGLIAWRFGQGMRHTLAGLGNWYADSEQPAPGVRRADELGDLARRLTERRITDLPPLPEPEPEIEIEPELEFEPEPEPEREPADIDATEKQPEEPLDTEPQRVTAGTEADQPAQASDSASLEQPDDAVTASALTRELGELPASAEPTPQPSAVLAIRLGDIDSLHRLPRPRLLGLLEQYREQLEQASRASGGQLHTLMDGSSLIFFHPDHPDQLGAALCCGELMRVLGHELQLQIADVGIALHIQIALCHTPCEGVTADELPEQSEDCAQMMKRMQHSRNLLLLDSELANSGLLEGKAVLRRLASQPGSHCVERLLEPYQSQLEQQLSNLSRKNQAL